MVIKKFILGPIKTNCYIVYDDNKEAGVIIDPAIFAQEVIDFVKKQDLKIEYILLTHGHFDHLSGAVAMAKKLGAKICLHQEDIQVIKESVGDLASMFGYKLEYFEPDIFLKDRQEFKVGNLEFKVIHTPGHSPGGVSFYFEKEKVLFPGDTLFADSYGRTDLPGGDEQEIFKSIKKLLELPEDIKVYPGHGDDTTIGIEKLNY